MYKRNRELDANYGLHFLLRYPHEHLDLASLRLSQRQWRGSSWTSTRWDELGILSISGSSCEVLDEAWPYLLESSKYYLLVHCSGACYNWPESVYRVGHSRRTLRRLRSGNAKRAGQSICGKGTLWREVKGKSQNRKRPHWLDDDLSTRSLV